MSPRRRLYLSFPTPPSLCDPSITLNTFEDPKNGNSMSLIPFPIQCALASCYEASLLEAKATVQSLVVLYATICAALPPPALCSLSPTYIPHPITFISYHSTWTTPTRSFTYRFAFALYSGYSDREEAHGVQRMLEHVGKAQCRLVYSNMGEGARNVARHIRAAGSKPKHK
ncbi:hypothetical protein C8R44DRAFT_745376 [Mycena epipterygia]|nr:hypothetical protein C8R44DRAFT_745376 [Mycena epipterygia]